MEARQASGRAAMEARQQIGKRARTVGTVTDPSFTCYACRSTPNCGSSRRAAAASAICKESKYVKVSVEGAQYQRIVDLRAYGGHAELWTALLGLAGQMLGLVVTYEDKDGDILLAGDLPWDMFVDSCKKLLIYKRRGG